MIFIKERKEWGKRVTVLPEITCYDILNYLKTFFG